MTSKAFPGRAPAVVRKFGGTSVGSAEAIRRVADIAGDGPCYVVLSAMSGVTQTLLDMVDSACRGERDNVGALLSGLETKHKETVAELLGCPASDHPVGREIDILMGEARTFAQGLLLLREATPRIRDAVSSLGERLSTRIFSAYQGKRGIPRAHFDARTWLWTDSGFGAARPLFDQLPELARPLAEAHETGRQVITEGFIGATADGLTTTLGRGGSDYTASILAAAVGAGSIEIWTDVTGVLTADPRLVKQARPVPRLTYGEAAELSYFGAKVLHPATVRPAVDKNIPVIVLNSLDPTKEGTRIDVMGDPVHPVKAVTSKRHIVTVTITSGRMMGAHGFLRAIFEIFDRFQISVDLIATAEVSVSITLDPHPALDACIAELSRLGTVEVVRDRSVLAVIGEGVKGTPGLGARIFGALANVNVEMISMGSSRLNLSLLVKESDLPSAVHEVHQVLFEKEASGR